MALLELVLWQLQIPCDVWTQKLDCCSVTSQHLQQNENKLFSQRTNKAHSKICWFTGSVAWKFALQSCWTQATLYVALTVENTNDSVITHVGQQARLLKVWKFKCWKFESCKQDSLSLSHQPGLKLCELSLRSVHHPLHVRCLGTRVLLSRLQI